MLRTLIEQWEDLAGPELAANTRPVSFAGRKLRRLIVVANTNSQPPWGKWDCLNEGPERAAFTDLRRAVNGSVAPHGIDHIDFIERAF